MRVKDKSGLDEHADVIEKVIPSTFEEEINLLNTDSPSTFKSHDMACYWQIRKDFLSSLDDFMTHDFLIGSTISTRPKKNVSSARNIFTQSVLSEDTEISKISGISNTYDIYLKHLSHASIPRPDFERYRNGIKKTYEEEQYKEQSPLGVDGHQASGHPSTFMKMIKRRSPAMSAANDERRQVLPARVIWDGSNDRFEGFRNNVEGHYGQIGAGYLFDLDLQSSLFQTKNTKHSWVRTSERKEIKREK